jgi:hypothetical protein
MCTAVLIGWDPETPPLPPHFGLILRGRYWSANRRHLFVTPWCLWFWRQIIGTNTAYTLKWTWRKNSSMYNICQLFYPKVSKQNIWHFLVLKIFSSFHWCQRHRWCTLSCEYLCKFAKKFETALKGIFRGSGKSDSWKKPEVKNLVALSLLSNVQIRHVLQLSGILFVCVQAILERSTATSLQFRLIPPTDTGASVYLIDDE